MRSKLSCRSCRSSLLSLLRLKERFDKCQRELLTNISHPLHSADFLKSDHYHPPPPPPLPSYIVRTHQRQRGERDPGIFDSTFHATLLLCLHCGTWDMYPVVVSLNAHASIVQYNLTHGIFQCSLTNTGSEVYIHQALEINYHPHFLPWESHSSWRYENMTVD